MELSEAINKANQILDEELRFPTVGYVPVQSPTSQGNGPMLAALESIASGLTQTMEWQELHRLRAERPRRIIEKTGRYKFKSNNYSLLCALLSALPEESRPVLVQCTLSRAITPAACLAAQGAGYPARNEMISELPLVAEFVARNGGKDSLISLLAEVAPFPAHALLLAQLEEMISLQFPLFSASEYERLSFSASLFGEKADRRSKEILQKKVMEQRPSDFSLPRAPQAFSDMISACKGLVEQCRKARFLYLEGELEEGLNLEINQDKDTVVNYLQRFGFSNPLIESLNEAERLYRGQATAFDLKNSMGHLRSFMEELHEQAIPEVCTIRKISKPPINQWSAQLSFLCENGILSKQERLLVSGLWALISDEAVHPLMAGREYARLARNMVIEYAFLFLTKLEKFGFRGRTPRAAASAT